MYVSLNPLGGGRLDDDGPRDRNSYAHPAAAVGRLRQPIRNRRVAEPLPSRHLTGHDHAGRPRIPTRDGTMLRARDRKSGVEGKSVSVRVALGGRSNLNKKKQM